MKMLKKWYKKKKIGVVEGLLINKCFGKVIKKKKNKQQ